MTTRFDNVCSNCGAQNDAVSSPEDPEAVPDENSITICMYCGHVVAFTMEAGILGVRELTEQEREEVAADPEIQRLLAIREVVMRDR